MNKKVRCSIHRSDISAAVVVKFERLDKPRYYHPSHNSIQRFVRCLIGVVHVTADETYVKVEKEL